MKYAALAAVLVLVACSDPVGTGEPQGIEVPNDGSIVKIAPAPDGQLVQTPDGLSFMTATGASSGYFAMSCTAYSTGRRCFYLYVGAVATTVLAVATCVESFGSACAGAIISAGYTWDQFNNEPDCNTCNSPFNRETSGDWSRSDKSWPIGTIPE